MKLKGKNAVITGANRGLGKAIAEEFVEQGANVLICARDDVLLKKTKDELLQKATEGQKIYSCFVDISKLRTIRWVYEVAVREFGRIDILVNNAGIQGTKGKIEDVKWSEWVNTININLLGTVYFCKMFIPHFKKNKGGKIINISGGGSANPRPYFSSYSVSKVGVVRFSETIAEELKEYSIDVNCVAPGALNTRMLDEVLEAGASKVGEEYYKKALLQKASGGSSLKNAAELVTFLASDESNGITGKLVASVWDKWREFPKHIDELKNSDLYTLRRIVSEDRNMK